MHSRETAVIHEFMHSDIIGTKKVLCTNDPLVPSYSSDGC